MCGDRFKTRRENLGREPVFKRICLFVIISIATAAVGLAQQQSLQPRQPVQPSRPAPIHPPFVLTPQQQQYIDQLLAAWEAKNKTIKTFSASVRRYKYDTTFGTKDKPNEPMHVDDGLVKYARPDKGLFKIEGDQPEQWVCDGESVFVYKYQDRILEEYKLPPDLRGKAIEDGPLPFIFTADAKKMKRRFWLRAVPPPDGVSGQYWIEAYPRHQHDAASFRWVEIVLNAKDLLPMGIQMYSTSYDGKENFNRDSYSFYNIVVNDPLRIIKSDPFAARTPFGWKRVVKRERSEPARVGAKPATTDRR
jgi:TIGR03009 family protein